MAATNDRYLGRRNKEHQNVRDSHEWPIKEQPISVSRADDLIFQAFRD